MIDVTDAAPLSSNEEEICSCVSMNRANLQTFASGFIRAGRLFELLERGGGPPHLAVFGGEFVDFRAIAAKEGALNVYHFGCSLSALRGQVGRCPRTQGVVSASKLKDADKLFKKHFPNADTIRHAVAHAGEVWASPERAARHRLRKDHIWIGGFTGAGTHQFSGLFNRTYALQWEGRVFEVEIDVSTGQKLLDVVFLVESAFT